MCTDAHSLKHRLKTPEGLLLKTVRKLTDNPKRMINEYTFLQEITDLVGIRVLYLYKHGWKEIDAFIRAHWDLHELPVANIRLGDHEELYRSHGCLIHHHPRHYRSVHYVIKVPVKKQDELHLVEVQVRTLFEEGWSEVDHRLTYSRGKGRPVAHPMLTQLLSIVNGLAGSAGELLSYIPALQDQLATPGSNGDAAPSMQSIQLPFTFLELFQGLEVGKIKAMGDLIACKTNLKNIGTALELWSCEHSGNYPSALSELTPSFLREIPKCPAAGSDTYSESAVLKPNEYRLCCAGHHHKAAGVRAPNHPRYDGLSGLTPDATPNE